MSLGKILNFRRCLIYFSFHAIYRNFIFVFKVLLFIIFQVKILPDTKFWSGFKNLKLLYLHDNGFAKLKNVCVLSACQSLTALTMFDCPVSLIKGYRHVLVNSIWTLKALDHHVISDEEIIQNWHLPERFKMYNQRLFFNFSPALKKVHAFIRDCFK